MGELEAKVKSSKGEYIKDNLDEEKDLKAFLQSGVINKSGGKDLQAEMDTMKVEYDEKIENLQKTIFEKNDHFSREMEMLTNKNKELENNIEILKVKQRLEDLDGNKDESTLTEISDLEEKL